jgi:hypothetical protein
MDKDANAIINKMLEPEKLAKAQFKTATEEPIKARTLGDIYLVLEAQKAYGQAVPSVQRPIPASLVGKTAMDDQNGRWSQPEDK